MRKRRRALSHVPQGRQTFESESSYGNASDWRCSTPQDPCNNPSATNTNQNKSPCLARDNKCPNAREALTTSS